jgi:hypothetical protein
MARRRNIGPDFVELSSRRSMLAGMLGAPAFAGALFAAPSVAPAAADPPRAANPMPAPTAASRDLWLSLRARLDGEPTFWYVFGTEFLLVDGVATPYNGRIVVMASRVKSLGGGAYDLPYVETVGSVTPAGEYSPQHRHPISKEPISVEVSDALRLNLRLGPDGSIAQETRAANGTRARYSGYFWESMPYGGVRSAISKTDVFLDRPDGSVDTLTEISVLRAAAGARAAAGFVPAEGETITSRTVADPGRYGGKAAWTVGYYHGRKCRSVAEMRRLMRPVDLERHAAFFDAWQPWARETG